VAIAFTHGDIPRDLPVGGSGAWPDPPPFGYLVRDWEDFSQLVRGHDSALLE